MANLVLVRQAQLQMIVRTRYFFDIMHRAVVNVATASNKTESILGISRSIDDIDLSFSVTNPDAYERDHTSRGWAWYTFSRDDFK